MFYTELVGTDEMTEEQFNFALHFYIIKWNLI